MPAPMPPGFILMHFKQLRSPIYIAIDDIQRFAPEDPYRDGGPAKVVTRDGATITVNESANTIAALIVDATTIAQAADNA